MTRIPYDAPLNATLSAPKAGDGKGIVHWLGTNEGKEAWTNPAEAGRMAVTRSSKLRGKASGAVGDRGTWCSTHSKPGSWYQFDFKGHEVCPVKYALRHGYSDSKFILRHWRLEASHDGRQWETLRSHSDYESLKSGYATASWDLQARGGGGGPPPPAAAGAAAAGGGGQFYRFFRVYQTGKNSSGSDFIWCSGFELWGAVRRGGQ